MKFKKGAMFGLDARIALAIFGALSVISSAALYSAIEQAKAVSILANMKEIVKAFEQYYLDTGTIPRPNLTYMTYTSDFVINPGVNGWKGPYLQYKQDPNNLFVLMHKIGNSTEGHIHIGNLNDAQDWGVSNTICTDESIPCYHWVILNGLNIGVSVAKKIDEIVDGSDGLSVGNFQTTHNNHIFYLKIGVDKLFK